MSSAIIDSTLRASWASSTRDRLAFTRVRYKLMAVPMSVKSVAERAIARMTSNSVKPAEDTFSRPILGRLAEARQFAEMDAERIPARMAGLCILLDGLAV